ncbi:MAG TPA: S8 family serine peptidase, partial [Gemmataceae bacterium]|nr:S8 family serine peptidase [Gemmataceae bacterium]
MHRTPLLLLGSLTAPALALLISSAPARPPGPADGTAPNSRVALGYVTGAGADRWHTAGFRGQGVKVLVLDTGFRGWRDQLGKALPEQVTTRSFRRDGNLEYRASQHGILCGEVVHSLAPAADLLIANWEPGHTDQFLDAIRWGKEQGARVVSVSVVAPSWSDGQGGGAVHHDLSELLGRGDRANDLVCFASAGNTTDRHWCGE